MNGYLTAGIAVTDLRPRWRGMPYVSADQHEYHPVATTLEQAHGVEFACPLCYFENKQSIVGVHGVLCWAPEVPQIFVPKPGRWYLHGTGFHDLTLRGQRSHSVQLTGGCQAHFFIVNGKISGHGPQ